MDTTSIPETATETILPELPRSATTSHGTSDGPRYRAILRRKIDDGFEDKLITTVRGVGYTIKD